MNDPLGLFESNDPLGLFDEEEPDDAGFGKKVKQAAKDAFGGVEAAAVMAGQIPAQIYGGMQGLGTLMLTGDVARSGQAVRDFQESNFGLGAPKPSTESGKVATEALGELGGAIQDKVGDVGYTIGGELGRTNAEVAAGVLGAFAPIPGGKIVRKMGKNLEKELGVNQPKPAAKTISIPEDPLQLFDDVPGNTWMEKQLELGKRQEANEQLFADKNNIQGEHDLRAKQMPVDENGMPVDMARSLDAQEMTRPDQPDLFNEGLGAQAEMQRAKDLEAAQLRERQVGIPEPDLAVKAAEMEKAYESRQKQLFDEEQQTKIDKFEDHLTQIEQELRDAGYTPKGDGQGPKTRAFNRKQQGAIDIQEVVDGFKAFLNGKEVGYLKDNLPRGVAKQINENANIDIVKVNPEVKGQGVGRALYQAFHDKHEGNIAPSGKTTQDAWNVWKRNYPEKVDAFVAQEAKRLRDGAAKELVIGNITDPAIAQRVLTASIASQVRNLPGQRGAVDTSFGDKRAAQLIAEENLDSKKMIAMVRNQEQKNAFDYLANDAGKWFQANQPLLGKAEKLRELQPWIKDQQLDHDAGLSLARVQDAFKRMQEAVKTPEDAPVHAQNIRFLLDEFDHTNLQKRYVEAVQEARNELNMRSPIQRTMAKELDRVLQENVSPFQGPGRKQRGAVDLGSPNPKKAPLTVDSPEVAAAKEQLNKELKQTKLAAILKNPLLDAYTTRIDSPEKVVALAPESKDLGPTQAFKARTISPGMNAVAISSNNPLLRFVRDRVSKVMRDTDQLTREFVTGPDGFGTKLKKLSQAEKNDVVAALQQADRKQKSLTTDMLKEAGFNEKQIDLIQHIQKMDAKKLEIWNNVRAEVGLPPVKNRQGHFAGNFSGDYRTLVLDKDKNVVGFIGTNTVIGNKAIQKKVAAQHPGVTFAPTKRQQLGGSSRKMTMFEGLQDIVSVLAKDDPRFADIQAVVDAAIKDRGDSLYGAALHEKQKLGIWGNEGNKFWEDKNTNTNQALKSFIDYWEGGIASHMNLPAEVQIKGLMDSPALDHMPRAKQYVNDYINNFTGRNLGTLGDALNTIVDTPARLTGTGPSMTREAVNQFNKRASQFTMGFINPLFLATQYLQVIQTGIPELVKLQGSLGLSPIAAEKSMIAAVKDGIKLGTESITGKDISVSPLIREAHAYAKDNGLLAFSEYVNAQDIFQGKVAKGFDKAADYTRTLAEKQTRPLVFFAAVDMLKDSGMTKTQIFDTAYNITQHSMVNYHASERPLMYGRLGVLGNTAGSLQTFKHAFLGQLGTLVKDAAPKKLGGSGKPAGLLAAGLAILAFTGVKGVPFYAEADELYKAVSDKFFKKRSSIADAAMENWPEYLKSGALSDATDVNMQSRLSAADVLPNSPMEAVSPFSSWAGRIGTGIGDVIQNNDETAWSNLAVAAAPSGSIKGLVENQLKSKPISSLPAQRQQNLNKPGGSVTLNRDGEIDYPRTERDTTIRKWTGGSSLDESLAKTKQYDQMINANNRKEAQGRITEQAKRQLAQGTLTKEAMKEFVERYKAQKGDPQQLVNALQEHAVKSRQTTQERLQGTAEGGLSSIYRYQNYND